MFTKAYAILRNADMTEGRGPMIHTGDYFFDYQKAADFIDNQPGVMGRLAKWSEQEYGDWEIKEIVIQ